MAIWPFGRKGKRHTVQLDPAGRGDLAVAHDSRRSLDESRLGRKPSRKQSKRRKNRHSQPVEDYPAALKEVSTPSPQPTHYPPSTSQSEYNRPAKANTVHSFSTANHDPHSPSRKPSLLKPKRNESPAVLKKKLSKRKAYEIAREREVRLMASTPIDIPRRSATTTPLPGDHVQIDGRQAGGTLGRRLDRHRSDMSLSMHDSASSSVSDFSETYTFKVNSFAAWTPRPVIRYVEAPRTTYSRNQRTPEPADRRAKTTAINLSEENLRAKKRIDELADDLDASALRELMERDRRRRERKQIEEQERLLRKAQRRAKKEVPQEANGTETKDSYDSQRGRSGPGDDHPETQLINQDTSNINETEAFLSGSAHGSWLRDPSMDAERSGCGSPESVHVIGNIDDSSIREQTAGQRLSFVPSQEMAMSRSTLSPSISPSRRGLSSPDSSQFYKMARESTSDISRNVESERHLPDHSVGRVNTLTSIFRRGSSRLKRSYRERFPDRKPPEFTNVSHESFFRVHVQSPAVAPYVPAKPLLGSSSFKRSQSKFTEHFGDEPLSPPDSRLQSPDIPEHETEEELVEDRVSDLHTGSDYTIPGSESEARDIPKNRHRSWAGDSLEEDPDDLPLSQSLASIDSEGSWMSGQYLRRISQRPSSVARQRLGSSRSKAEEGFEKSTQCDEVSGEEQFVSFGAFPGEATVDGCNHADEQDKDLDAGPPPEQAQETWHEEIAKKPVLVNPAVRPKSNEGLLNNIRSLSPISAEEEFSLIEEHSSEVLFSAADGSATTYAK